jgi:hypothetical protein
MEFDWFLSKIILKHTLFISDQTPDYQNYIYEKQRINSKEISITRGIVFFYIFVLWIYSTNYNLKKIPYFNLGWALKSK